MKIIVITLCLFISILPLDALTTLNVVSGPDYSILRGVSSFEIELKNAKRTWNIHIVENGTIKPINNFVGKSDLYLINDLRNIFAVNVRPATQANKIVVVLARNGNNAIIIEDVGGKVTPTLKSLGYTCDAKRIYAIKALNDGLLLEYMPDIPTLSPIKFIIRFKGGDISLSKAEIEQITQP